MVIKLFKSIFNIEAEYLDLHFIDIKITNEKFKD